MHGGQSSCVRSPKRDVYRQSQLLLTKALAERPKVGVHTKIDVAVAELDSFALWNEAAVAERQDKLTTLARSVWGVPATNPGDDAQPGTGAAQRG